jgi:hypothetical protein
MIYVSSISLSQISSRLHIDRSNHRLSALFHVSFLFTSMHLLAAFKYIVYEDQEGRGLWGDLAAQPDANIFCCYWIIFVVYVFGYWGGFSQQLFAYLF